MNLISISYQEVQVGDLLFIKTDNNKKGEPVKVVKVDSWETKSNIELMYKLTFENGDEWFGWGNRELKLYA